MQPTWPYVRFASVLPCGWSAAGYGAGRRQRQPGVHC